MYKKILLLVLISLSILTTYYILPTTAFAQTANAGLDITISPTLMELTANPGDTLKEKFRIRNNSSQPIDLSLIVNKLDPHSRNGEVVPVQPQPSDSFISWMSFPSTTLTARAKEWTDISFTIAVPKSAAFGYYYALRIGPAKSNNTPNGATTKLLGQIVLPVLLNVVSPGAKSQLQLVSFSPVSSFNEYLPVTFQIKLANTGNVHIRPAGNIFIKLNDNDTAILDMNQAAGIILPGGVRTYTTSWMDGFVVQQPVMEDGSPKMDKNGKIETTLVFNWDRLTQFRIGKYTATALVVYDNGKKDVPLEATTTFWVFPWKILVGLVIIMSIGILVGRIWLTWYVKRAIKKSHGT